MGEHAELRRRGRGNVVPAHPGLHLVRAVEEAGDSETAEEAVTATKVDKRNWGALAEQGFRRLVAPFDGIVTARETDIGALINVGATGGAELFVRTSSCRSPVPTVKLSKVLASGGFVSRSGRTKLMALLVADPPWIDANRGVGGSGGRSI